MLLVWLWAAGSRDAAVPAVASAGAEALAATGIEQLVSGCGCCCCVGRGRMEPTSCSDSHKALCRISPSLSSCTNRGRCEPKVEGGPIEMNTSCSSPSIEASGGISPSLSCGTSRALLSSKDWPAAAATVVVVFVVFVVVVVVVVVGTGAAGAGAGVAGVALARGVGLMKDSPLSARRSAGGRPGSGTHEASSGSCCCRCS